MSLPGAALGAGAGRPGEAQHEDCLLLPNSPYAASKAAADLLSYQLTRLARHRLARPYNHIGPRESPQFAIAHFAGQMVAIGRRECLLSWSNGPDACSAMVNPDVRDTVAAYLLLMEHGRTGEAYNVASGHCCSMREVVEQLLALTGLHVELRQRAELLRPTDLAVMAVDAGKLRREAAVGRLATP